MQANVVVSIILFSAPLHIPVWREPVLRETYGLEVHYRNRTDGVSYLWKISAAQNGEMGTARCDCADFCRKGDQWAVSAFLVNNSPETSTAPRPARWVPGNRHSHRGTRLSSALLHSLDAGVFPPCTPSRPPVPSPPLTVCA